MRHIIKLKSLIIAIAVILALSSVSAQTSVYKDGFRKGRVVVKMQPTSEITSEAKKVSAKGKSSQNQYLSFSSMPKVSSITQKIKATQLKPVFYMNPNFQERFEREGLHLWYTIDYDGDESPLAIAEALINTKEVQKAEAEAEIVLPYYKKAEYFPYEAGPVSATSRAQMPYNDPMLPEQWHYHNTGQYAGVAGSDINAFKAWEHIDNSDKKSNLRRVIVAIMDQGVDWSHEDLRENMWTNLKELTGKPGVDDDGNGLIDDIYGFDFNLGHGDIYKGEHGTHVAGTVSAVNNNGKGVAGVAGGSGNKDGALLMTLPVIGDDYGAVATSFIYAADNGALVAQCSWGFNTPDFRSEVMEEGIHYFIKYAGCDNQGNQLPTSLMKGGAVMFASGNMADDKDYYPGAMPEVISVSALNHQNLCANYSNYGAYVTVSSYGGQVGTSSDAVLNKKTAVLSTMPNNTYGYIEGTSMATPHVSGIAALAISQLGGVGFTADMLRNYLVLTSRDNEANYDLYHKGKMGKGIVDAYNSIISNNGIPPKSPTNLTAKVRSTDYLIINFTSPEASDANKVEGYKIFVNNLTDTSKEEIVLGLSSAKDPNQTEEYTISNLIKGNDYKVEVVSHDIWGNESARSVALVTSTASEKGLVRWHNGFGGNQVNRTVAHTYSENNTKASFTTQIKNIGNGDAYYKIDSYHRNHSTAEYSPLSKSIFKNPTAGSNGIVSHGISFMTNDKTEAEKVFDLWGFTNYISYLPNYVSESYIGEMKSNGVMYPSSAAVKFVVPADSVMPGGFTLTEVIVGFKSSQIWYYDEEFYDPDTLRLKFEIYRGGDIPELRNRIYSGTLINVSANYEFVLSTPYNPHFEAGESFFIVIHADKRYQYPLGIISGCTNTDRNYFSNDEGKTWKSLSSVYSGTNIGFTIAALSSKDDNQKNYLISETEGYLRAGETKNITVEIDAEEVKEGRDTTLLVISTDAEVVAGYSTLWIDFNLTRNHIVPVPEKEYFDYGVVSLGGEVEKEIKIYNQGMGNWSLSNITLSNTSEFSFIGDVAGGIQAGDSITLNVKFKPTELGARSTVVKLIGVRGEFEVLLTATVVEPPEAKLEPAAISVDVFGNQLTKVTAGIANLSNYSLTYEVEELTKAAVGSRKQVLHEDTINLYKDTLDLYAGYKWFDNRKSEWKVDPWIDIAADGVELTEKVDFLNKYTEVKLPFTFPYYGESLRSIYVGVNGAIKTVKGYFDETNIPVSLPDTESEFKEMYTGMIAPLWIGDGSSGHFSKTKFYYKIYNDRIVMQWNGLYPYLMEGSSDVQATLYPNGEIEFKYRSMFTVATNANTYMVGWSSNDGYDGHTIWYLNKNFILISRPTQDDLYAIKIVPPAISPVKAIKDVIYKAAVNPQAKKEFAFNIDPTYLKSGANEYKLKIKTNDPNNKVLELPITINKTDIISVEFVEDSVDYGNLIFSGANTKTLQLFNTSLSTGPIELSIEGDASNIKFSENNSNTLVITSTASVVHNFNVDITGSCNVTIKATNPANGSVLSTMTIKANSLATDNVSSTYITGETLTYDLQAGESEVRNIKITAPADKDLKSNFYLPGYLSIEEVTPTRGISKSSSKNTNAKIDISGYRWMSSEEEGAPQYIWNDISTTGTPVNLSPDLIYEGNKIDFEFPFYGEKISTIYVLASGRISSRNIGWDVMSNFVAPRRLPCAELSLPFISGMWTRQWYNVEIPGAGLFIDSNEDRVIVQYHMFQFDWLQTNGISSYQIILYKDGTIQFVYKDIENSSLSDRTTIGIQGKSYSDTEGYTYSLSGSTLIKNETTITAKPVYGPIEIEKGKTKEFKVTADSRNQKGGEYNDYIFFTSENFQKIDSISTKVTISSSEMLSFRESSVDFGEITIGDSISPLPFTVQNSGNKDLVVEKLYLKGDNIDQLNMFKKVILVDGTTVTDTIVEIELPIALSAGSREVYYVGLKNKTYDQIIKDTIVAESTSGQVAKIACHANIILPSKVKITDMNGNSSKVYNMNAIEDRVQYETYKIEHVGGNKPIDYKVVYEFVKPTLDEQRGTIQKSIGTSTTGSKKIDLTNFNPIVLSSKDIKVNDVPNTNINGDGIVIEPYASVSLIKDRALYSMIGLEGNPYYSFAPSVKLETGENGIVLSHVRGNCNALGPDTAKYTVRIYRDCKEPSREHLLYEKVYRVKSDIDPVADFWFPLDKQIAFGPNETFWIEIEFGSKLTTPLAIAAPESDGEAAGNYYRVFNHRTGEYETLYEFTAIWAIWGVQESYLNVTNFLTLPSEQTTIEPGQKKEFETKINKIAIPLGVSDVNITVKSPGAVDVEPLNIKFEKYKELEWTQFPDKPMLAKENETVTFFVKAEDTNFVENETDSLDIRYTFAYSVTGAKIEKLEDGSAKVTYKIPYNASFMNLMNIEATSYSINKETGIETPVAYSIRRTSVSAINVNRPVIANNVKPMVMNLDPMNTSITLPTYYFFIDPDLDQLTYGANLSSSAVSLTLNENGFIFTPMSEGLVDVTLYASDGEFDATCTFRINVVRPYNYAPTQIINFSNQSVTTGGSLSFDLSNYFIDWDGDEITYEAWSSDTLIAKTEINGSVLNIYTYNPGIFSIGLKAIDTYNAETLAAFAVQANGENQSSSGASGTIVNSKGSFLTFSQNPARVSTIATYSATETIETGTPVLCEVFDTTGRMISSQIMTNVDESTTNVTINVSGLREGVYLVTIKQGDKSINTQKLIVR